MMITRHADTPPRPNDGKQREQATSQPRTPPQGNSPPAVSQDGAKDEEKRNGQPHGTMNGTGSDREPDGEANSAATIPTARTRRDDNTPCGHDDTIQRRKHRPLHAPRQPYRESGAKGDEMMR